MSLVEARDLRKSYPVRRGLARRIVGETRAVDGVSFALAAGRCLALVGESGCGKSTLARCLIRLEEPTAGRVLFGGEDLTAWSQNELRRRRKDFQMVFQDPASSLNPRRTVRQTLTEPLAVHRIGSRSERGDRVVELLDIVGLSPALIDRFPHALSGGEKQRVGIARALAPGPRFLIADEPVSALDAPLRSQLLDLLSRLRRRFGMSLLVIAHDLALVGQVADRVAVLYLGRIVEMAEVKDVFRRPLHPYTRLLLDSVLSGDPRRRRSRMPQRGEPTSPPETASGCRFSSRCPIAGERCWREDPPLLELEKDQFVACHHAGEQAEGERESRGNGTFSDPERRNQHRHTL